MATVASEVGVRLPGRVEKGMFPNERAFVVTDHDDRSYVVIVPDTLIETRDGVSTILVRVINSAGGVSLVRVPGEPLDSSPVVSVSSKDLLPA